jgi:predicted nucleic acid-binding protein
MTVDLRVALDTNVLAYAEGVGSAAKHDASLALIEHLALADVLIPAQCLGELFRVLRGKALRPAELARDAVLAWADAFQVADSTGSAFIAAMDLCAAHGLHIWDALILTVAADHHCRVLLSEDLQQGFTWRGVTVVNPYADVPHPLLAQLRP